MGLKTVKTGRTTIRTAPIERMFRGTRNIPRLECQGRELSVDPASWEPV